MDAANAIDHVANRRDHQVGIIELNPMAARGRDDVAPAHRKACEFSVAGDHVRRLIATRDHNEWDLRERGQSSDHGGGVFEDREMTRSSTGVNHR